MTAGIHVTLALILGFAVVFGIQNCSLQRDEHGITLLYGGLER